jgi:hypothetical protein
MPARIVWPRRVEVLLDARRYAEQVDEPGGRGCAAAMHAEDEDADAHECD